MNKQTQQNILELVHNNYKEIASDFNQTRKKFLWPELIKLTNSVKNNDKILDVGCGNGKLLEAFKNKKINYIGIDSCKELIELAKQNQELGIRNQKFLVGDILELDKLQKKDFDYVFCLAVLPHLPGNDLRLIALEQLKNKISQNGKIIITVWNMWSQKKFRKLLWKFVLLKLINKNKLDFGDILFDWKNSAGQAISQRYYHAFTKQELKRLFKKAGLKTEKFYKDKYNYYVILKKNKNGF
ncbi:MAG: class I SAM-dependent methyltransferase [Patescibacteria group bacterium]|nr:class I SAM-dependent methyltransferase [Patescibacteria group bacterium]MBU2214618.1 class I SAM-dependent methyltransferase [Patescibacteria group bacterium]MBU2250226.1 class I SAM-dependent methyltransferase [Patescibacteria group bacterium]